MTPGRTETTPLRGNDRGEGWHLRAKRRWCLGIVAAVMCGLFLLGAAGALAEGNVVAAVLIGVLGVAFASIPLASRQRPLQPRLVDGGLLLPTHGMSRLFTFGSGVLGFLLLLAPVVAVTGMGESPATKGLAVVVSLFPAAIGVLFLLGAWGGITGSRRRDKGLLLTPEALVLNTQAEPMRIPWDAVLAVRPHWSRFRPSGDLFRSPEDPVHNWLSFPADPARVEGENPLGRMAGTPAPTMDAEKIAVDREGAVAVLRYYLEHPAARAELGGPSSLAEARRLLGLGDGAG